MNSRIAAYRLTSDRGREAPSHSLRASSSAVQKRLADGLLPIEQFAQQHPLTGLAVAFGLGIFFGWVIKCR